MDASRCGVQKMLQKSDCSKVQAGWVLEGESVRRDLVIFERRENEWLVIFHNTRWLA